MASVLLVDDDRVLLSALARYLRRAGHSVITHHALRDAVNQLGKSSLDFVVTDYRIGPESGMDLIALATSLSDPPRCILMSGGITKEEREWAIALGAARVLTKPFLPRDLVRLLDELERDGGGP